MLSIYLSGKYLPGILMVSINIATKNIMESSTNLNSVWTVSKCKRPWRHMAFSVTVVKSQRGQGFHHGNICSEENTWAVQPSLLLPIASCYHFPLLPQEQQPRPLSHLFTLPRDLTAKRLKNHQHSMHFVKYIPEPFVKEDGSWGMPLCFCSWLSL